jgi:hypothetical protein
MTTTLTLFLAFGEADAQVLHFDLNCCIHPELFKSSYIPMRNTIAEALEAALSADHRQPMCAAMHATTWHVLEVTFDNEHIAATWKDLILKHARNDYIRFYGPLRLSEVAAFFVHKVAVPATGLDEWAARFMKKVEASFNGTCVTCDRRGLVGKGVDKSSGNPDKQEWCVPCWYKHNLMVTPDNLHHAASLLKFPATEAASS